MSFKGLNIGVSGLKSQSRKMEVIGHNLANLNTAGYKRSVVRFAELYSDVIRSASGGDGGNIGGTNPMEVGLGVGISAIHKVFTQGARINTGRALDFQIDGEDFFVVKNSGDGSLMLTRNGSFDIDGDHFLVDDFGNKVQGFNVAPTTQTVASTAGDVQLDLSNLPPQATTQMNLVGNLDSSRPEQSAGIDSNAWAVFSGGENFGSMEVSSTGSSNGIRTLFGSGYYEDNTIYQDTTATLNAGLNVVTLNAAPAGLIEGFRVGDTVSVLQGGNQVQRTVSAINTATRDITLSSPATGFAAGATTITNLTNGSTNRGTSGAANVHNDVLRSQISMVDGNGRILASFYRVDGDPKKYTQATASIAGGGTSTVGVGEFTNIQELKELMETALRDNKLTNYTASTDLSVGIDRFGQISFSGTGLVQSFRLVINADNTEMLDRFSGIAITDNGAVATTQARVDANGEIIAPPALGLGNRAINSSKVWYSTAGLENYGYNSASPATEYGEFAGLRIDSGATGTGYGTIEMQLVNGLGNTVTAEFRLVQRDADANNNEFSTMGELAILIQNTLRSQNYSSLAVDGVLQADDTAAANFNNGRLGVSTSQGVFDNLIIRPKNITPDAVNGITRTDATNFGTVLGDLSNGVNGKSGYSNKFLQADLTVNNRVYDSHGNEHFTCLYFLRDRTAGLTNIEWKFKASLNPNINTFAADYPDDKDVYGETFNSIQNGSNNNGVLAFDITTHQVLGGGSSTGDPRYTPSANLRFLPQVLSQEADQASINIDFTRLTSAQGKDTVDGSDTNGYALGTVVRVFSEDKSGNIMAYYTNNKTKILAKVGLMHIGNPEGLEKAGSSYYIQTPNSNSGGTTKGVDQVFAVGQLAGASSDSVESTINGGSLEASNVDLTEELTEMIVTQRTYSASGKIITTSDELLQEALNLKR